MKNPKHLKCIIRVFYEKTLESHLKVSKFLVLLASILHMHAFKLSDVNNYRKILWKTFLSFN